MDEKNTAKNTARTRGLAPPWKPGQSGNKNGRPKGSVSLVSAIKRAMKETVTLTERDPRSADPNDVIVRRRKMVDVMARALIREFMGGNKQAIKEIMGRIDGVLGAETAAESSLEGVTQILEALGADMPEIEDDPDEADE